MKVGRNWIRFDRVVMATNNPLVGLAGLTSATLLQTKLSLYTSYAFGAQVPTGTIPEGVFWDTRDPYDYLRIDKRSGFDYIVFGGEDHKTGQKSNPKRAYRAVACSLEKNNSTGACRSSLVGADHFHVRRLALHRRERRAAIHRHRLLRQRHYIRDHSGNDGARLDCENKKSVERAVCSEPKKNSKALRGIICAKTRIIPYYMIKDRLARPEAASVRELKTGRRNDYRAAWEESCRVPRC